MKSLMVLDVVAGAYRKVHDSAITSLQIRPIGRGGGGGGGGFEGVRTNPPSGQAKIKLYSIYSFKNSTVSL